MCVHVYSVDPLRKFTVLYFFLIVNVDLEAFFFGWCICKQDNNTCSIQLELFKYSNPIDINFVITPGGRRVVRCGPLFGKTVML